jgi:hypothetical protein
MDNDIKIQPVRDQEISFLPVENMISGIKPDLETVNMSKELKESGDDDIFNRTGKSFDSTYLSTLFDLMNDKANKVFFNKFIKRLREKLEGQIIVDLGAGNTNFGYSLSLLLGVSKYIAVEKFEDTAKKLNEELKKFNIKDGKISLENLSVYDSRKNMVEQDMFPINELIPVSIVQDKILHFLKRLPDNSVSVLTSGINYGLIDNTEYRDAIALEIERVLDPKGLYISKSSDIKTNSLFLIPDLSNDQFSIKVFNK